MANKHRSRRRRSKKGSNVRTSKKRRKFRTSSHTRSRSCPPKDRPARSRQRPPKDSPARSRSRSCPPKDNPLKVPPPRFHSVGEMGKSLRDWLDHQEHGRGDPEDLGIQGEEITGIQCFRSCPCLTGPKNQVLFPDCHAPTEVVPSPPAAEPEQCSLS